MVTLLPGRVLTHGEPATGPNTNAIPIEESIGGMMTVIAELNMEQTGHTIQWDGEFIE